MSSSSATVVVQLPNGKSLSVSVPENKNAVCEVKRAVSSSLQLSPLLQRVSITGAGVDAFSTPVQVSVSVREGRKATRKLTVQLLTQAPLVGNVSSSAGPSGSQTVEVEVDPEDSVLDFKFLLADRVRVLPDYHKLYIRAPQMPTRVELSDGVGLRAAGVFADRVQLQLMFESPAGVPGHGTVHFVRPDLVDTTFSGRTMGEIFLNSARTMPSNRFLGTRSYLPDGKGRGDYEWLTYGQAATRVANFSAGLRSLGVKFQDTVGIVSLNRTEWVLTDMTCNVSGFISVPLYDTLGADAIQYIINHASIRVVVAAVSQLKSLYDVRSVCPTLEVVIAMDDSPADKEQLAKIPKDLYTYRMSEVEQAGLKNIGKFPMGDSMPKPDDILTICYTSGTTGNPKGVVLTQANVVAGASGLNDRLPPHLKGPSDVLFSYLPLAHIYERINQAGMIGNSGAIGFSQGDPLKLLEDVQTLQPTFFPGVPRVWQRIYDKINGQVAQSGLIKSTLFNKAFQSKLDKLQRGDITADGAIESAWDNIVFKNIAAAFGGKLKMMSTGSAPLSSKVAEFLRVTSLVNFTEGYGLTETAAALTAASLDTTTYGHVGLPLGSMQVKLVDVPDMDYLSTDKPHPRGEIWVTGTNIFQNYFKQPDVTAEVMEVDPEGRRWFKTGDIGVWNPDGTLKIVDRKKALFKLSQGEYLRPEYIEGVYKQASQLASVFVHGDSNENFLVAVVYPEAEALKQFCAANRVKGATVEEQVRDPRVAKWLFELMDAVGRREKLRGFELVKRIHVSGVDFSVANGLLTPTLKLKRAAAAKYFAEPIAKLYKEGPNAPIKASL